MNAPLDEVQQLYAVAQRDMTSLDILIASGRTPHETIGFLAQQACEKLINVKARVSVGPTLVGHGGLKPALRRAWGATFIILGVAWAS